MPVKKARPSLPKAVPALELVPDAVALGVGGAEGAGSGCPAADPAMDEPSGGGNASSSVASPGEKAGGGPVKGAKARRQAA